MSEPKKTQQPGDRVLTPLERALLVLSVATGGVLLFFGAQFFASLALIVSLSIAGNNQEEINQLITSNSGVQFAFSVVVAGILIAAITFIIRRMKKSPREFLRLSNPITAGHLGEVIVTYGIYFLVLIATTVIVGQLTTVDVDQSQDLGAVAREGWGLAMTFVSLVVLAPIVEEVFFRGFLYRVITSLGGRIAGYVIVCLLFGAAHLEFDNLNYIAAIDTLIFSAFLIYIYEKHASLQSAIMLHALKNSIAFIALFVIL